MKALKSRPQSQKQPPPKKQKSVNFTASAKSVKSRYPGSAAGSAAPGKKSVQQPAAPNKEILGMKAPGGVDLGLDMDDDSDKATASWFVDEYGT